MPDAGHHLPSDRLVEVRPCRGARPDHSDAVRRRVERDLVDLLRAR
ncbi:hypothetical protein LP422_01025 [Janibacter limosus]|uniref:Uncharacterized protein n=1 Tax=Janibacter limosus TaxID=53458 RepID=A0AC61U4S6_9MICO|nr:hypothetical protein [Janibacter limosus]UUZ44989.1 hypothetical protein LP422_01025 [Janibacter limosus]